MDEIDALLAEYGDAVQVLWDYALMRHNLDDPERATPVDAFVLPGGYDDRPAAHAAELFMSVRERQRRRPVVVATGFASPTARKQWRKSEAAQLTHTFEAVLRKAGASPARIAVEPDARNLGDNAKYVNRELRWRGVQPRHIVIVCKPYLQRRTYATFLMQGPGNGCLITMQSPPLGVRQWLQGLHPDISPRRSLSTMVGDFERVAFPNNFLRQQAIPRGVWQAYVHLNEAGFSRARLEGPGHGISPNVVNRPIDRPGQPTPMVASAPLRLAAQHTTGAPRR